MVLDDDRDGDGVGHGPVVGDDGRVVGPGQGRRREHHRVRPGRLGLAGEGDRPVRARVTHTDADRQVARRCEDPADDRVALIVTQAAGLAEHAQDRHAIDALRGDEPGERRQAVGVQRAVRLERGRDDGPDPFEPLDPGRHR